jgi:hypothetical protein
MASLVGDTKVLVPMFTSQQRCVGRVINLIVKDGLKFVGPVVDNIRESIKYLRVLRPLENKCSNKLLHEKVLQARKSHH